MQHLIPVDHAAILGAGQTTAPAGPPFGCLAS
jgi:hypothetical protein